MLPTFLEVAAPNPTNPAGYPMNSRSLGMQMGFPEESGKESAQNLRNSTGSGVDTPWIQRGEEKAGIPCPCPVCPGRKSWKRGW